MEAAAKACGLRHVDYSGMDYDGSGGLVLVNENGCHTRAWNPLTNSADCATMCAKLIIGTEWCAESNRVVCFSRGRHRSSSFSDHNNDREAAWRHAATMVAAKIGGYEE